MRLSLASSEADFGLTDSQRTGHVPVKAGAEVLLELVAREVAIRDEKEPRHGGYRPCFVETGP